jgi:hypothetical protein
VQLYVLLIIEHNGMSHLKISGNKSERVVNKRPETDEVGIGVLPVNIINKYRS